MENGGKSIYSIEQELQQFPPLVITEFRNAMPLVKEGLSEDDFYTWVREGVAIAQSGFHSWKAAAEYFRVTLQALESLNFAQFINWARWGRMLSEESTGLSSADISENPETLDSISIHQLEERARLGKSLYKGTWRSTSLAWRFFQISPSLLPHLTIDEIVQFSSFIDCLDKNRREFAGDCLESAEEVLSQLEIHDRRKFLDLAVVFAKTSWNDAKAYFKSGPKVLSRIERGERARFLSLTEQVSHRMCRESLAFFIDGSRALSELPNSTHRQLLILTEKLLNNSCLAAVEFLKSCPMVLNRITLSNLEGWHQEGVRILQKSEEGGVAYFRMELNKSARVLEQLSRGVELSRVGEVMGMYCQALTGKNTPILPTDELKGKEIGWASLGKPSSEGAAVFLPEFVDRYPTKEGNFAWYKVVITHQAGHLEFGSFDFCFEKEASLFNNLRSHLAEPVDTHGALTDLQRFFDLFSDRKLVTDTFTVVEDSRVDYLVNREYKGICKDYKKVQSDELRTRPPLASLPLREVFLEILIQIGLDNSGELLVPSVLRDQIHQGSMILRQVQSPHAKVEDSAEATLRLYHILCQIPNESVPLDDWETIDLGESSENPDEFSMSLADDATRNLAALPDNEADVLPYTSPQMVEFRGDFKPELVQLLTKLKAQQQENHEGLSSPLSLDALAEQTEKSMEIEIGESAIDELTSPQEQSMDNILREVGQPDIPAKMSRQENKSGSSSDKSLEDDSLSFFYNEWDFRANDYKLKWCRVRQKTMNEGTPDFFEATLKDRVGLVALIKRQFEMLSPQLPRKVKRLPDGEEFELDAVIDSVIDKRAGHSPSEKVYWRRNKTERDVCVAFLLDMSASTSEYIDGKPRETHDWHYLRDYKGYSEWLQNQQDMKNRPRAFKRIIDLEKEGAVLLIKALETIGDTYAIYGFSGYGRENVEFYIIKDFEEEFSDKIKGRIDSITPIHSTRMGPAVRHATWKLEQQEARSKFLFLISDGRPQDRDYGGDGLEYAINDTKMALTEAKWKNITPFCLTIDPLGHDYLKTMCRDMRYEVLADIESLPKRLPALYRRLTI